MSAAGQTSGWKDRFPLAVAALSRFPLAIAIAAAFTIYALVLDDVSDVALRSMQFLVDEQMRLS